MQSLLAKIKNASEIFNDLDKKPIHIISKDSIAGVVSSTILLKTLERGKINFSLSFIKKISETFSIRLKNEMYECYIFLDMGLDSLKLLTPILESKTVFIIDSSPKLETTSLIILNAKDITIPELTYLFATLIDEKNKDLSYLQNLTQDYQDKIQDYLRQNKPTKAVELCINLVEKEVVSKS